MVTAQLADNPDIDQLVIEGHADERRERRRALVLSRARAGAVTAALVARGVSPERLVAIGFGALCPIDPHRTAAAAAQNRRVWFVVTRVNGQRTLRAVGCPRSRRYVPSGVGPPRRGE